MIELIENKSAFDEWTKRDIFTVRILALLNSYSTKYHFCTFYRQVIDGRVTAIISKLDRNFTLSLDEGYDSEELVRFFCLNGYDSILCDDSFFISPRYEEGDVMISSAKRDSLIEGVTLDEYPKLMDLFNFIDYGEQDFKSWYVDISHRVRHKTAKAYTLVVLDEIIASGILSSIIDNYAILTAVRTRESFRHMGYGTMLVSAICSDVRGYVYIMRESDENEEFYTKLGFENIGKWRLYR